MAVDGTYDMTMDSPLGKMKAMLTLREENGSLSGKIESRMGTSDFSGGKVEGNKASCDMKVNSPIGKISLSCNVVFNGDEVTGELNAGKLGIFPVAGWKI